MYTPIPVIINVGIPIPKPVPRPILSDVDKPEEELELRPEPPLLLGLVLDVGVELEGATWLTVAAGFDEAADVVRIRVVWEEPWGEMVWDELWKDAGRRLGG
jgi:hypothetical protein